MTTLDPRFANLLAHLHRGGTFGQLLTTGKRSHWWNDDGPGDELPADNDQYFGAARIAADRGAAHMKTAQHTLKRLAELEEQRQQTREVVSLTSSFSRAPGLGWGFSIAVPRSYDPSPLVVRVGYYGAGYPFSALE